MQSITRQLSSIHSFQKDVHQFILTEYERRKAEAQIDGFDIARLRTAGFVKLILDVIGSNPAVIVIDALDEVEEKRRHEVINALKRISRESESVVKIFVTYRDNSNISALLVHAAKIRIQNHDNRVDVELLVRHHATVAIQCCSLLNGYMTSELQEDLVHALLDGTGEM